MNFFQAQHAAVGIPAGCNTIDGWLQWPAEPAGLILFADAAGDAAEPSRNQRLSEALHDVGFGTLTLHVRSSDGPAKDGAIAPLADRLRAAIRWCRQDMETRERPMGCFASGNAVAAALVTAADPEFDVQAVVACGGRPDLAGAALQHLRAPTMLIAGGNDDVIAALNLETWARLHCEKSIEIIPGASHFFEERGALENVAALATRWFTQHLRKPLTVDA
jgi:putative phosphoribosyl transferase